MDIELERVGDVTVRRRMSRSRQQPAGTTALLAIAFTLEVLSLVVLATSRPGAVTALAVAMFCVGDVLVILGWDNPSFRGAHADGPDAARGRALTTVQNR